MRPTPHLPFAVPPLQAYLRERLAAAGGALQIEAVAGGQSNPTFFLSFAEGGRYVLRKQPGGSLLPSAHAIDREYRVLAALAGSDVPVPPVLLYCAERELIGTPFYIMQRLDGRVFHDASLPGLQPAERQAIFASMNDTLVRLHRIDVDAVGLSDYGKPGNYFARQIQRWSKQFHSSGGGAGSAAIEKLIAWLPAHIPPGDETRIAHGDYRLGNLLIHAREPRVIAVLDWELSTLGHPLADLGYNCMVWHARPQDYQGIAGLDLDALGIPGVDAYAATYCRAAGRSDALQAFHVVFALFRVAVIMAGIVSRAAQGNAAAANAAEMDRHCLSFAAKGCQLAGI